MAEPGKDRKVKRDKGQRRMPEEGVAPGAKQPEQDKGEPAIPVTPGSETGTDQDSAGVSPSGSQVPEVVEDPVEILVGLAERGEIDPWNIDIIEVTDRFLSELDRRRQLNLQLSGRTLFYAATLLRMKSEQLEVVEVAGDEEGGDDLFGDEFGGGTDEEIDFGSRLGPIERLEHEIQRRLDRKNMRKSPITLFELITELKNIEKEERRRRRMADGHNDLIDSLIDADDVVSIAHEEGFQESSLTRLAEYLEGLEIDEEMTLAELCKQMEWGIPEVYIPLLFLALDGRCNLRQEEFFGDIFVQICRAAEGEKTPAESTAE
jgi:segregation and condensation protein A